jgi:hypothetical protein
LFSCTNVVNLLLYLHFWHQKARLRETFTQKYWIQDFENIYYRRLVHILINSQTFSYFLSFWHTFSAFGILSQPWAHFSTLYHTFQLFAHFFILWPIWLLVTLGFDVPAITNGFSGLTLSVGLLSRDCFGKKVVLSYLIRF